MGTRRALGKDGEIARGELLLTLGGAQRRPAGDDEQPFLAPDLVVVGPGLLTGRKLVEAAPEQLGAELPTDGDDAVPVARPVTLPIVHRYRVEHVGQGSHRRFGRNPAGERPGEPDEMQRPRQMKDPG